MTHIKPPPATIHPRKLSMAALTRKTAKTQWQLTDEAKAKIPAWNKAWQDIALSTDAMTDADRIAVCSAIHWMYEAAKLPHDDIRIVFVPSPLMAAVVAGAAAAFWHQRKTKRPTGAAATAAATYDATYDGRDMFPIMLLAALRVVGDTPFARGCIEKSWRFRNGGNMWAAWPSFLSFVRDVIGFKCKEHEAYAYYETCSTRACWRFTHEKFVIVSDRPCALKTEVVRGRHRLHCEDGPAMAFRDGWSLWYIHGAKVDEQIVMRPETQTIAQIDAEGNNDVRAIRIERFGWVRYLEESGAKAINSRTHPRERTLETLYAVKSGPNRLVVIDPATEKRVALGVPREVKTCAEAQAWITHGSDDRAMCRT